MDMNNYNAERRTYDIEDPLQNWDSPYDNSSPFQSNFGAHMWPDEYYSSSPGLERDVSPSLSDTSRDSCGNRKHPEPLFRPRP